MLSVGVNSVVTMKVLLVLQSFLIMIQVNFHFAKFLNPLLSIVK